MTVSSLIGERLECQSQDGRGDARIECQYQGEIGRCCAEAGERSQDWKNVGNLWKRQEIDSSQEPSERNADLLTL